MRIVTRLAIIATLPAAFGLAVSAVDAWSGARVDQALHTYELAGGIELAIFELYRVADDHLRHPAEARPQRQLQEKQAQLSNLLSQPVADAQGQGLLKTLRNHFDSLNALIARVRNHDDVATNDTQATHQLREQQWQQSQVLTQAMVSDALRLSRLSISRVTGASQYRDAIVYPLRVLLALLLVGVAYLLARRIKTSLRALRIGTERITEGDLEHRIPLRINDELGALADSFNQMAQTLSTTMASRDELERSNRDLDEFAYIASHDLKEPLRGIYNYSSFLLEDYGHRLEEDGQSKLQTLLRLATRMEALIDALLWYSRVGRTDIETTRYDLNAILREVLDSLQQRIEQDQVNIAVPRPLPAAQCNQQRTGEVFQNLISNAIKYNDKIPKQVEIGYLDPGAEQADRAPNGHTVFWVRDNGIGIREKHLDSVFHIFKRLHARDKYGGGTGAGLTIVRKIIELHGGDIWVDSSYGQGSTFYFTLPTGEATYDDA